MDRPYQDQISDQATMFVGTEVEHSPAHGKKTLFVVGVHSPSEILSMAEEHQVEHVYIGANQSFPSLAVNDFTNWQPWERMIEAVLGKDYYCTLDFPVECAEGVLETGFAENHLFIPMISVKLPYVQLLGYNATIKLDDIDFAKTNPGVWCHQLHNLMNRDNYTSWTEYTKDTIVK